MQIFDSRGQLKESVARFFRAKGSAPRLILEDVNADADERLWDWQASNGQLALRTRTDADESGASPIVISRQGTTVTAISLAAGALTFNGTPLVLQSRQIMAGTGLTGGGDLSADRTISLSASTISAVNLAMSAVQPGDLANVAFSGDYADLLNTPTIPPDLSALQFLTAVDESTALPNSRRLVAGSNITFDTSTPGQLTIHATGSGGGGAVNAVIGGTGISVDNTDPTEPVVSLSADSQAALALATTAVQPEDLALVAFSGEYSDLSGIPSTFAPSAHTHNASDINAGTLADERLSTNIPRLNATNTFSAVQTVQVSGTTPLAIRRVGSSQSVSIEFRHDGATRYLGLDVSGNLRVGASANLSASGTKLVLDDDPRLSDARTPVAHTHLWADITDKPTTFTPSAHTHLWADITDKPTTFTPSAHTHLWADITDKPTTFTPSTHTHDAADIVSGTLASARIPDLAASKITSGTLSDSRLSANIPRLNVANTFSAVQTVQVSGTTPLSIRRVDSSQNVNIEFQHSGATRYLGLDAFGNLRFGETANLSGSGVRVSLEGHTHSGEAITSGTIADARLSSNVPRKDAPNVFTRSGAGLGSAAIAIAANTPNFLMHETDQDANGGLWVFSLAAGQFRLGAVPDDYSGSIPASSLLLSATRSGAQITSATIRGGAEIELNADLLDFNGDADISGSLTVGGTISGNGSGLTNLNASNLSSGTVPDARLSPNVMLTGAYGLGSQNLGSSVNMNFVNTTQFNAQYTSPDGPGGQGWAYITLARNPTRVAQIAVRTDTQDRTNENLIAVRHSEDASNGLWYPWRFLWHTGNFDPNTKANASHTHLWADITDKPTTFAPSAHTHLWADITDKPTTFTPSAHTHAIADVTGLQAALDGKAAASHTHDYLPLSGGTLTGNTEVAPGAFVRFRYWSQFNDDDGKIGAGLYEPGLNIIGAQTHPGLPRHTRIFGSVYLHEGGRLYDADGTAYLKSNYSSGNVTISTSAPSGGSDGDIWLQVL